jgi:hypothetical protein
VQTLAASENIPAGMNSRTYDLSGYERVINLVYKTRTPSDYNGHAQLTVKGLS